MAPFYGRGSIVPRLQSYLEETVYFLPLSFQEFLLLIWSTSKGWKAGSTFKPPSGIEPGTPALGIQCNYTRPWLLNQWAIDSFYFFKLSVLCLLLAMALIGGADSQSKSYVEVKEKLYKSEKPLKKFLLGMMSRVINFQMSNTIGWKWYAFKKN